MRYYIITGTSRGIGEGIARALLRPGNTVFALARHDNPELKKAAEAAGAELYFHKVDVSEGRQIDEVMDAVFGRIDFQAAVGVYLVNNAGVLQPIGPVETHSPQDDEFHMRVNLLAPMHFTGSFISRTGSFKGRKVVATISSGAAQRPYHGWITYCSGKAGIEMFTRVVGLEQQQAESPVIVYAIAPGIVDTQMQAEVRQASDTQFRDRAKFLRYHEKGYLASTEETGRILAGTLDDPKIKSGDVLDIRDMAD